MLLMKTIIFVLGTAEISNVEFSYTGQRGMTDPSDPRFSVAFVSTKDADAETPAYVINCAFHHGYSTAIGVFDAAGVIVRNNVIMQTYESGMSGPAILILVTLL